MNNQQRRRQADPEGEDNPPPAYDQQRLPPYTNTSMASDSHHGNSEDLQGDSQKHEDHH